MLMNMQLMRYYRRVLSKSAVCAGLRHFSFPCSISGVSNSVSLAAWRLFPALASQAQNM
jgi:hypothetical protein